MKCKSALQAVVLATFGNVSVRFNKNRACKPVEGKGGNSGDGAPKLGKKILIGILISFRWPEQECRDAAEWGDELSGSSCSFLELVTGQEVKKARCYRGQRWNSERNWLFIKQTFLLGWYKCDAARTNMKASDSWKAPPPDYKQAFHLQRQPGRNSLATRKEEQILANTSTLADDAMRCVTFPI